VPGPIVYKTILENQHNELCKSTCKSLHNGSLLFEEPPVPNSESDNHRRFQFFKKEKKKESNKCPTRLSPSLKEPEDSMKEPTGKEPVVFRRLFDILFYSKF
jgi:hypothetical protein